MEDVACSSDTALVALAPAKPTGTSRRLALFTPLLIGLSAGAWYGWHWWSFGRFLESTENAYFQADNVSIAPQVGGIVVAVPVDDNQAVEKGELLAQIDDRDYRIVVEEARADLAAAKADYASLTAQESLQQSIILQEVANLAATQAASRQAEREYWRYQMLASQGNGTVQRFEQAESEFAQKSAADARGRAVLESARKQLDVIRVRKDGAQATIDANTARLGRAELELEHTQILAPTTGVIGDKKVRVGQFVTPGARLLTVVPMQDIYLVANLKETQLEHIIPGKQVAIEVDALPGITISGTVASLAPGSGSQFSLLPPENATGNFTKIVQRVPIKILLDRNTLDARLRPGLSAKVVIDATSALTAESTGLRVMR
jgi:membrane fusion protein, multidrug efflux system